MRTCWVKLPIYDVGIARIFKYSSYLINYRIINRSGELSRWETFTAHNAEKYVTLSQDDASIYFHTPNKTLIYVVHIPDNDSLSTSREYMDYYRRLNPSLSLTEHDYNDFGNGVIFNDYELFIEKVYHTIMAL